MVDAAGLGLGRPRLWPLGLVSFLLRGGFVLYLLPIVAVPSTVGVATWVGPTAITPAGPSERFVELAVIAAMAALLWFVVGGLVAAAAEAALIRQTIEADEGEARTDAGARSVGSTPEGPIDLRLSLRVFVARLVAALPFIVVLGWGIGRIASAGYAELTHPIDTATPLPVRVLADVPGVLLAVLATWLLAETVGGIAARRIVILRNATPGAMAGAVFQIARHPLATLGTIVVTVGGALALMIPGLISSAVAWDRLGEAFAAELGPAPIVALSFLFVAIWVSGLALAGAAASWRSAAWTLEVCRFANRSR